MGKTTAHSMLNEHITRRFLKHPQSSSHSEATADSKTQLEIALKENPWASIVNEPMLMRLNLKDTNLLYTNLTLSFLAFYNSLTKINELLKETASYYVKKANKQWK